MGRGIYKTEHTGISPRVERQRQLKDCRQLLETFPAAKKVSPRTREAEAEARKQADDIAAQRFQINPSHF